MRLGLTNNPMTGKLYTSEVWLRKRYLMDKKSPEEIAKECGASVETIYVYLAKERFSITDDWNVQVTFIVIDKYNLVYPYQVSSETLVKWTDSFSEVVQKIKWHYENKRYDLPYELALGNIKL